MKLRDVLNKLKGTEQEALMSEINASVDELIAGKLSVKDKEITTLKETNAKFALESKTKKINEIAKKLVGDNEKELKTLLRLTDLDELEDEAKIKEAFQSAIKEYSIVITKGEEDVEQEDEVEVETDDSIDEDTFNEEPKANNVKNEIVNSALEESK